MDPRMGTDEGTDTAWRDQPTPDPAVRRAFLDARRRSSAERYDTLYATTFDRDWGAISPSHQGAVGRLLELTRPRGTVLDAPCGTGKYWPQVLASGRSVVGVDQSIGMLREAAAKHPDVPLAPIGLQELPFEGEFDAVMCIDALENVGPEDWPIVLERLRASARPGAPLYLTVELANEADVRRDFETARAAGEPVVPGESFDGVGYHYYPTREAVHAWLDGAGLERLDEFDGDEYRHFLLRRPA
ncbi:MAG: class I SAM-dependent methyltransferase [Candidatus Limnocylindrales bacterium]